MGITSLSGTSITPTKPRTSNLYQASAVQNTWYTLLASTTGRGILNRVTISESQAATTTNNSFEIRLTVDGTQTTINNPTTNPLPARANSHMTSNASANGSSWYSFDFLTTIYFKQSIQVEIRHTQAATPNLTAVVDYSLE